MCAPKLTGGLYSATTAHTLLPYAIKALKAKGYKLVTVAECLGKSAYLSETKPKAKDVSTHRLRCPNFSYIALSSRLGTAKRPHLPPLTNTSY